MRTRNLTNLLFLGPWPPPFGGIASNLYELVPGLAKRGYRIVTLSYIDAGPERTEMPFPRVQTLYFSPKHYFRKNLCSILRDALLKRSQRNGLRWARFFRALTIAHRMNALIREHGICTVLTYDNEQLYPVPFLERDSNASPAILATIYAGFFLDPIRYIHESRFLKYAIRSADRILSCSRYCAESGKAFLGIDYPTSVLYNNVDETLYRPDNNGSAIRRRFGFDDDAIVVMTMARMSSDMGYDFLLDEANAILALDTRLVLLLVGARGDYTPAIETVARENPRIRCAVDIPFEEKPAFFAACDIFTAPSREKYACLGIANIEAMMSGKPIISSASGGHVESVDDGIVGYLVPFCRGKLDTKIYLSQLRKLARSTELRQKLGRAGRERGLRMFTNDKIVEDHIAVINSVLNSERH